MEEPKQTQLERTTFNDLIIALEWCKEQKNNYFDLITKSVIEQYIKPYERLNTCENYLEDLIQTKVEGIANEVYGNLTDF